jgi:tetratricopeptide (TPR) repeat protein
MTFVRTHFFRLCVLAAALVLPQQVHAASAEAQLAVGERALIRGDFRAADGAFAAGLRDYPDDPRFAFYGGISAWLAGNLDTARTRLDAARTLWPEAEYYLGVIALEAGDPAAARDHFRTYLTQRQRDPHAELLLGVALTQLADPAASQHLNNAARLDVALRTPALFFRGLSQADAGLTEAADKALRAVVRLNENQRFVGLSEQALDLLQDRGEFARRGVGEVWLDAVWDDNPLREVGAVEAGLRTALQARYAHDVLREPRLTVGGWLQHDLPVTQTADGASSFGGFLDFGAYKANSSLALDYGSEFDLGLALGDTLLGGYGLRHLDVNLRPRLYLFGDDRRSLKLFAGVGWRQDLDQGFSSGLRQEAGLRGSWTGWSRRRYLSLAGAWINEMTDAAAYRRSGFRVSADGQISPLPWLYIEGVAGYAKYFHRSGGSFDEDVATAHLGIGWTNDKGWLVLATADHEYHTATRPDADWQARAYGLRIGRLF